MCEAAGLQAAVQVGSSPVQLVLSVIQSLLHAVRKQEQESANFNFLKSKYSFLLVIFLLRKESIYNSWTHKVHRLSLARKY